MGKGVDYTPEQVTEALLTIVAHGGNCAAAAEELIDNEFMVPASTLRRWKNETHAERYDQLELKYAGELEQLTIEKLRRNAHRAAEVEAGLLEEMANVPAEQKPQALRAVADVKAKSIDKLLALTGRTPDTPRATDMAELARALAAKGLLKVNVSLDVEQPANGAARDKPQPQLEGSSEPG